MHVCYDYVFLENDSLPLRNFLFLLSIFLVLKFLSEITAQHMKKYEVSLHLLIGIIIAFLHHFTFSWYESFIITEGFL